MEKIAIVGMSGAFPGARNISELWRMICDKEEGLSELDPATLLAAGVSREEMEGPDYVPRGGFLDEAEIFDNEFFDISPGEALVTDPQQRLFLEHSWLALEDAGYEPERIKFPVGVFAGEGVTQYWFLLRGGRWPGGIEDFRQSIGNNKDFIATRVSYKLDLKGPSLNVQTGCSTGLAAVGLACQSLLTWGCDMALAGAASIAVPRRRGYTYIEGLISSRSGRCMPFDARADGTLASEGVGVVCLKRLSEALADGDYVYAVLDSVAINNDGSDKVGYTAPSYKGQAEAIQLAQALAEVSPEDIGFVETHGTATYIGDPIEVQALMHAFRKSSIEEPYCWLGAIKANIGHTDAAAGIASLIKTALVVNTGIIPPLLHFETANPQLGLESSKFRINSEKVSWPLSKGRRVAGLSSFGIGGTNVHAIVESPPTRRGYGAGHADRVLLLAAKSPESLSKSRRELASYIKANPELPILDLLRKNIRSRHDFRHRWGAPARDRERLVLALEEGEAGREASAFENRIFLFPGQGSQFSGMAAAYYGALPIFSQWIDRGLALAEEAGLPELRSYLLEGGHDQEIAQTDITQPLLYIVECAIARELMGRGIEPTAVAGHSIGEYAAAAIAEVLTFEEGFALVVRRGYWMQRSPAGAMTAVFAPPPRIEPRLLEGVAVSVVNSSGQTVLSGCLESIERLEAALGREGLHFKRLRTSRAFHSPLIEGIIDSFEEDLRKASFHRPALPFISNVDGGWLGEGLDWADYWREQLRRPVRFDACIRTMAALGPALAFEAGPGRALSSFIEADAGPGLIPIQLLPGAATDDEYFDAALIKAWELGCPVSWKGDRQSPCSLVLAPGYAFSGKRFWPSKPAPSVEDRVAGPSAQAIPAAESAGTGVEEDQGRDPGDVAQIWKATLGGRELEDDCDFFEAGGDSLIAVQLLQAVKARFKVEIPVSDFLRRPTLAALRAMLASVPGPAPSGSEKEGAAAAAIQPRADRSRAPLSTQQERLWFLHELNPEKPLYNQIHTARIEGTWDRRRLRRALELFFSRHDIFRATIDSSRGIPFMSFIEKADIPIEEVDFSLLDFEVAHRAFDAYLRALARKPLDFSKYPLSKAAIFDCGAETCLICLLVPHILSDGWSADIFSRELREFYDRSGDESWAPPALAIGYGDYAAWEREGQQARRQSDPAVAFWKDYLRGIPEAHDLPLDRTRPKEPTSLGSSLHIELSEAVSAKIHRLCEAQSLTPNMFFLACLALVLRRHSSQETVVIGTPLAIRDREELRGIFGCFIRTIPLRFEVDEASSAASYLAHVKSQFLSAWDHSSIGLDDLVSLLAVPRTTNINPIYQVMYTYQRSNGARDGGERGEDGLLFARTTFDRGVSENDLALYVGEGEVFEATFEYAEELFDAATMEAYASNFARIAGLLAGGFSGALEEMELMDEEGRELARITNRTEVPAYLDSTFLELFAASLAACRDAPAVKSDGASLSYGDLDCLSGGIARRLLAAGSAAGEHVGVYMIRDRWLLPSLIGVLKSGGAYVPLDPSFPRDRLAGIVSEAGIRHVLTSGALESEASALGHGLLTLCVDSGTAPAEPPLPKVRPDQTAYILFTSGSTGKPKGVPIRHGALANLLQSMRSEPGISRNDTVLALTTFTFDISALELFLPLTCGAKVVLADQESSFDTSMLVSLIEAEGITYMQATPSRWTMLLETGWKPRPGMRFLTGGEALPRSLAKSLVETGAEVWNMYGPTETTVWSSVQRVDDTDAVPAIGRPIANTAFFVLDRRNRPQPAGIPGELGISGAGLSPGYLNRPDLTASSFVEIDDGGTSRRVYKTGDLVLQRPSGEFRYFGRNDFQVKIRGFRIELGEIENAITRYPQVSEAVCTVWKRSDADKRIIAYYRSEAGVDEGALQAHLRRSLPDYMIPSHFVFMERFPRTLSGKVDRRGFPLPLDASQSPARRVNLPPCDALQAKILEIWEEVLEQDGFGISENFFDLGGHSLVATRLIREMNTRLGKKWMLRDLFEHPTIEELSRLPPASKRPLIPLVFATQKAGDKTAFFLASGLYEIGYHEGDGETAWERDFFRYFSRIIAIMGKDRPIYSLRPRGIFKGERFRSSVESMAEEYIEEIRLIQRRGPYLIGGECLGGNIAYEIALRLQAQGEKVKLLLLDTDRGGLWSETKYLVGEYLRKQKRESLQLAGDLLRSPNRGRRLRVELDRLRKLLLPLLESDRVFRRFEHGSATLARMLIRYRPRRFTGEVALFINQEWNQARPNLGWDSLICPKLTIRVVPGNHATRLTIHGDVFARMLQESCRG